MKFLFIPSIAVMITGSSANDVTTDNRLLQWNPNCGTLALWHPDYTTGWSGGYCTLQTTCNSPSYSTEAECCNAAYAGQSSYTCYTKALGAPVPGVPAAGTWYPDYNAGWDAGKCINTLPLPPYGSRPLYATQLECCKIAYAGQTNNFCIKIMDGSPTSQIGTQWYPLYDAAGTCTTKLPLPPHGARSSYYASKEECCQDTYRTWSAPKTANCISGSSSNPSKAPATVSPLASPSKAPVTASPFSSPSASPSASPTTKPVSTKSPTTKLASITKSPSTKPVSTKSPTTKPVSTKSPTTKPVSITKSPSNLPTTTTPSGSPDTASPSESSSNAPTTLTPSESPNGSPDTASPSESSSNAPTTLTPSESPNESPVTASPSLLPPSPMSMSMSFPFFNSFSMSLFTGFSMNDFIIPEE